MQPHRPSFFGRRHWLLVALLISQLSILNSILPFAPPSAEASEKAVASLQTPATVYLPLLARPKAPAPAGAPVIDAFELSSASGPMAAETTLSWRVRGATQVRVEPRIGDVTNVTSTLVYPIAATTTFTLTATNEKGSATATATYQVTALPSPNPLAVSARADTGRAAATAIGVGGGLLQATGADGTRYTLSVPPEALVHTEVITLTPTAGIEGLPFPAQSISAVSIAPEGLLFIEPATLTITPPTGPVGALLGFAFAGPGSDFHLRRLGGPSSLTVITARSYGITAMPSKSQLATIARAFPSDPLDGVEHLIAGIVAGRVAPVSGATLLQSEPGDDDVLAPLIPVSVHAQNRLKEALANPALIDAAVRDYVTWRSEIKGDEEIWREEISASNLLLGEALRKAGELAAERCSQGRPAQGFAFQRFMAYAKRFGLVNTSAALAERLEKCWRFRVTFQSHILETGGSGSEFEYDYKLRATVDLSYDAALQRMVGAGPLTWVSFTWNGTQGCPFDLSTEDGLFDAASGARGFSLEPVSRTSPEVRLRFAYDPGTPAETVRITCPMVPPIVARTTGWLTYFTQMHAAERLDGSFVATKQLNLSTDVTNWTYANSTTGPGGQLVREETTLTVEHTPG